MAEGCRTWKMGVAELEREKEKKDLKVVQSLLGNLMSRKHQCRTRGRHSSDELLAECRQSQVYGGEGKLKGQRPTGCWTSA